MDQQEVSAHVLIFPLPAHGHVNSMLKLAELLCLAGLHVTFLVSDYSHHFLLRQTDAHSRFSCYPRFSFQTISDGIPADHPRTGSHYLDALIHSLRTTMMPLFRELLVSNRLGSNAGKPLTCIIADGVIGFALDVADEVGIPVVFFRTVSACSFWCFFCIPRLLQFGELPFKGDDLDLPIKNVPGMEGFLRRRDLPSPIRAGDLDDIQFQFVLSETRKTPRARALILNTFEELEAPVLSQIRTHMPNLYTVGPLHSHPQTRISSETTWPPVSSSGSPDQDRSCFVWLDAQPPKSVVYVNFGTVAVLTRDELMEFWHGLVNSGQPFLWVIRPDLFPGESQIPADLREGTKQRGYIVGWTPQEELLAHWAVGGFLTHSGWNSTLESIVAGMPMICWPYFGDQQINSRYVAEVWSVGLDMKDKCDRVLVEKMVKDLMVVRKDEFRRSANRMAELARLAVGEGGSSCFHLDRLIQDIKLMTAEAGRN